MLIAIEGIDGAGKATQARLLRERRAAAGCQASENQRFGSYSTAATGAGGLVGWGWETQTSSKNPLPRAPT